MSKDSNSKSVAQSHILSEGVIRVQYPPDEDQNPGASYTLVTPEFYDANRGALLDYLASRLTDQWMGSLAAEPDFHIHEIRSRDPDIKKAALAKDTEERATIFDGLVGLRQAFVAHIREDLERVAPTRGVDSGHDGQGGTYLSHSGAAEIDLITKFVSENPGHPGLKSWVADKRMLAHMLKAEREDAHAEGLVSLTPHSHLGIRLSLFDGRRNDVVNIISDFIKWRDGREVPSGPAISEKAVEPAKVACANG